MTDPALPTHRLLPDEYGAALDVVGVPVAVKLGSDHLGQHICSWWRAGAGRKTIGARHTGRWHSL